MGERCCGRHVAIYILNIHVDQLP